MITDFFNSIVDIKQVTREDDDAGNWNEVWNTLIGNLPCCIQPRRGFEIVSHNKLQSEVTHVMYCLLQSVAIKPSNRLFRGNEVYDILDIRNVDYLGRFLTIDLREVEVE